MSEFERKYSSYDVYMKHVDRSLAQFFGLGHEDVEDYVWCESFEDEISPSDAVDEFMLWAGYTNE